MALSSGGEPLRVCFLLPSPTYGMHQYTADLANRAESASLVTTVGYPAGCYAPEVCVFTPVTTADTGFSPRGFRPAPVRRIIEAIAAVQPSVVHITGPHLWNTAVLAALRRAGMPTVHTLHDLDPHPGSPYGALLGIWNAQVIRRADVILVHARRYRDRLLAQALGQDRVVYAPLLHGFWGYAAHARAEALASGVDRVGPLTALLFGRLERYKGIDVLLRAWSLARGRLPKEARLIVAGRGELSRLWPEPLPAGVEVIARHVEDDEALDLFAQCAVVVLPYTGATQSALVAAAYYFRKPVIVTRSGGLPEYVDEDRTGWVVEPGDAAALADALVAALSDGDRAAAMGTAGRAWFERARQEERATLRAMYARLGDG